MPFDEMFALCFDNENSEKKMCALIKQSETQVNKHVSWLGRELYNLFARSP
jgi:hypothetical protein